MKNMNCAVCDWTFDGNCYYCDLCGSFSMSRPIDYVEPILDEVQDEEKKCRHVWECLRDRCHNRGKGKYQAYKCKLCGKFQRR